MADISASVGSAVIVPSPPPTKRRRSSAVDDSTKRPRLSSDNERSQSPRNGSPPQSSRPRQPSIAQEPSQERRKASIQEERKRGQRLFGGLLSTLSQTTPNGQNKRRQEIERKQQERAKLQKATDEEKKKEKLANLKTIILAEQSKFEEQSMKTRHVNMRAMTNFLSTKTGPKLYYKPWELLPDQENVIKQQKTDIDTQIEDEWQAFYSRHEHLKPKEPLQESVEADATEKELVGEANIASDQPPLPVSSSHDADTTNSPPPVRTSPSRRKSASVNDEQNGDILVENDEDAVIY